LITFSVYDAVWFAEAGVAAPQKFLNGFRCEFGFRSYKNNAASTAEGFAFVMQGDSIGARGSSGIHLGYGGTGIANSVAIEFDGSVSVANNDSPFQHIAIHTRNKDPNSADQRFAIGVSENIGFNFANNSKFVMPCEPDPAHYSYSWY